MGVSAPAARAPAVRQPVVRRAPWWRRFSPRVLRGDITDAQWIQVLENLFRQALVPVTYFGVALVVIVAVANLAITRMGFSLKKLAPQFNRLNPASRLKELPGQNLKSVLEAVVLLGVLGLSITTVYRDNINTLMRLPFEALPVGASEVAGLITSLLWKAAGIFILFGSVDLFRQYRKHMSSLKMSKGRLEVRSIAAAAS